MNILEREKNIPTEEPAQEEEIGPECIDTKLVIWDDDEIEELEVDYLNQVYPEKLNKTTMTPGTLFTFHFLSSSLHYWVEMTHPAQIQQNKLSHKDIKYLSKLLLEQECENSTSYNRWGEHFNKQGEFMEHETKEKEWKIPTGEKRHEYSRKDEKFVMYKYTGDNEEFIPYKRRFQILFLLYIDGVSFVMEDSEQWEYTVIFKEKGEKHVFVGVLSKYIFRLSTVKQRHRISQVFILPPYQNQGHGSELIDIVYKQSLNNPKCFEITTEEPSFEYQCLRDFKETSMMLDMGLYDLTTIAPIKSKQEMIALQQQLLSSNYIRSIKETTKIPGHQIQRIVNLLIYARILSQPEHQIIQAHYEEETRQRIIYNRSAFKSRKKIPHITFNGQTPDMKEFFIEKAKEDYIRKQGEIQELLTEILEGYQRVIAKLNKKEMLKFQNA